MNAVATGLAPTSARQPDLERGSLRFIGTATVLLQYAGFTILTDPNFLHRGDRVHLGYGLQSHRLTDPAMELEDLPPLDLVILSHLHEDHFDRVVERKLDPRLPILTTRQAANALHRKGFRAARPLRRWQTRTFAKGAVRLRITAMPGKHGPGVLSAALPAVMGSMLEFETPAGPIGPRIYVTGDTLLHGRLAEIPRRYPAIDLALLHLGGTRIFGVMLTMDARQGVDLMQLVQPRTAIPIHYNDYPVFKSPLEDFRRAVAAAGLEDHVRYLAHGDTYTFTATPAAARGPA